MVHRCRNYDFYHVVNARSKYRDDAKKRCEDTQMSLPKSRSDECLGSFLRILAISHVNNVWIQGVGNQYYSNPLVIICVKGKDSGLDDQKTSKSVFQCIAAFLKTSIIHFQISACEAQIVVTPLSFE